MSKCTYVMFEVYPDSAPENWMKILKDSHGAYAISPLHDPDPNDKKPHYHVIYKHGGPLSESGFADVIPPGIAANNYFERVTSPRGYQRYLIHLDDPDKQQFDDGADAITTLNGFPLDLSREFSKSELSNFRREICTLIEDNCVYEYYELMKTLEAFNFDLADYAAGHTVFFTAYLASRRYQENPGEALPKNTP